MKTEHINFTEKTLATLPLPDKSDGVKTYYDSGSKNGLCLIVSYGGSKTFYFLCYFQDRPVRVKIGKLGHISLADARRAAITMREHANKGEDPSAPRREFRESMTLRDFYNEHYKPRHALVFKRLNSIKSDDVAFRHGLKTLHSHKMIAITRDDIARVHATLRQTRSPASANHALALISNMYNKAIEWGLYPREKLNPVFGIRKFPEPSRDRFMTGAEIRRFFSALATETNVVFRNYIMLSLLLGQRRNNILSLRWDNIDLENEVVFFPDTKNHESLRLPMTTQTKMLLCEMQKTADSEWLLPSPTSKSGHYEDPKKAWKLLLDQAEITNLRLHDLRRTLASYQAMAGSSLYIIGKSLGHKSLASTQVYARLAVEPIRESMQRGTDKMLGFLNMDRTPNQPLPIYHN